MHLSHIFTTVKRVIKFLRIYVAKIGKYGDWNGEKWCSKTKKIAIRE